MFVVPDVMDTASLWQGDIVQNVQLLGALNYGAIAHALPSVGGGSPLGWSYVAAPVSGLAMVLSHSCEVAKDNGVKLTGVILAPIRDLSQATPVGKYNEIITSNRIGNDTEASYLKYFYVEPHSLLPFEAGGVADFSKCFSMRKNSYDVLLNAKILQLEDDLRESMALKLALYFHRSESRRSA